MYRGVSVLFGHPVYSNTVNITAVVPLLGNKVRHNQRRYLFNSISQSGDFSENTYCSSSSLRLALEGVIIHPIVADGIVTNVNRLYELTVRLLKTPSSFRFYNLFCSH